MVTVVVLPLVPVTPTVTNCRAGQSYAAAATTAAARRLSRITIAGKSVRERSSTTAATAPPCRAASR